MGTLGLERVPTTLHFAHIHEVLQSSASVEDDETTNLMDCGSEGGYIQPDHTFMHDSVSRVKAYKRSIPETLPCHS